MNRKMRKMVLGAVLMGSMFSTQIAWAETVDLTLSKAIEMALLTHPNIKMAEADKISALGAKRSAYGAAGPKISYGYSITHTDVTKSPDRRLEVASNNNGNVISLAMPVYTGGKIESTISQAKNMVLSSEEAIMQSVQETKLEATNGYYTVLQTRNLLKLAGESVTRLAAHLANVQAQYNAGTVAKVDVLRSQVELANAEQELIKAQKDFDLAKASLNNIVGLPQWTEINLLEELTYLEYQRSLDQCIELALANRPEISISELSMKNAKLSIRAAQADYLPQVSVNASENFGGEHFPGNDTNKWVVGADLKLNIFDSGVIAGKVREQEGVYYKSQEALRKTTDAVQLEVRGDYLSLKESEKRIYTAKVAVVTAEEDYKISQIRYRAGVGTNIDVLDSQVALTKAQTNYVQALYDYNTAWARLEKSIGTKVAMPVVSNETKAATMTAAVETKK